MTSEADAAPLMAKEEPVTAQETEPVRAETSVEQDGKPIASAAVPPTEGEQQDDSVHPTEEKQNGEQRTAQTPEAYKAPLPAPSFDLGQDPIYIYGQVELPNEVCTSACIDELDVLICYTGHLAYARTVL